MLPAATYVKLVSGSKIGPMAGVSVTSYGRGERDPWNSAADSLRMRHGEAEDLSIQSLSGVVIRIPLMLSGTNGELKTESF